MKGKMKSVMEKRHISSSVLFLFLQLSTIFWSKNFGIVLEVFGMFQFLV